jgi:hypothetical protein
LPVAEQRDARRRIKTGCVDFVRTCISSARGGFRAAQRKWGKEVRTGAEHKSAPVRVAITGVRNRAGSGGRLRFHARPSNGAPVNIS